MINAVDENFVMHRRFVLTVALKIGDRNENFTTAAIGEADEASETNEKNEKKVDEATAIDEAIKEKKEKEIVINQNRYLTKIFSTALVIMIFNS